MNIPVKIKKLYEDAKLPYHGSEEASGYDAFAHIPKKIAIPPHETVKIGTGLAMQFPKGYRLEIMARSGIATNEGLRPANCVGLVDSDYRGEIIVPVHNDTNNIQYISPDEKIAQLVISEIVYWDMIKVDNLEDTDRGKGGFGSTGKK